MTAIGTAARIQRDAHGFSVGGTNWRNDRLALRAATKAPRRPRKATGRGMPKPAGTQLIVLMVTSVRREANLQMDHMPHQGG